MHCIRTRNRHGQSKRTQVESHEPSTRNTLARALITRSSSSTCPVLPSASMVIQYRGALLLTMRPKRTASSANSSDSLIANIFSACSRRSCIAASSVNRTCLVYPLGTSVTHTTISPPPLTSNAAAPPQPPTATTTVPWGALPPTPVHPESMTTAV